MKQEVGDKEEWDVEQFPISRNSKAWKELGTQNGLRWIRIQKNSRVRKACAWLSGFCNAEMLETSLGCVGLKVQLNAKTSSILFGAKTGFDNVDIQRTVMQRS